MCDADKVVGHLSWKLFTDDRVTLLDALCALLVDGGGLTQVLDADHCILNQEFGRPDTVFRQAEVERIATGFAQIGK